MSSISDNRLNALSRRSVVEAERSVVILGKEWISIPITSGKDDAVNSRNNLGCETLKSLKPQPSYCKERTVPLTSSIRPFAKEDPPGRKLLISGMRVTF